MIREQRKQATRARIIEAATELFNKNGYEATDHAAIAKRAGVAYGTIYTHFKTKEYLLIEFFLSFLENQLSLVNLVKQEDKSDLEYALRLMTLMWEYGAAYPNLMIRTFYAHNWHTDESTYIRVNETVGRVLRPIGDALIAAQKNGEISKDVDLKIVMTLLHDSYLRVEMDGRFSNEHKKNAIKMFDEKVAYLLGVDAKKEADQQNFRIRNKHQ